MADGAVKERDRAFAWSSIYAPFLEGKFMKHLRYEFAQGTFMLSPWCRVIKDGLAMSRRDGRQHHLFWSNSSWLQPTILAAEAGVPTVPTVPTVPR